MNSYFYFRSQTFGRIRYLSIVTTVFRLSTGMTILKNQINRNHKSVAFFVSERININLDKQRDIVNRTLNNSGSQIFSIVRNTADFLSESEFLY